VNALLVALLVCATAVSSVALGVFGAYCAVTGLLATFNSSRRSMPALAKLVPRQIHASGD
jgi:hypothetical protein